MKKILETARLRLREFNLADTAFIIKLLNSPGWIKFIGDRNVRTEEQAIHYLEKGPLKSYMENGFGLSMVELKDNNTPIGMCGILKRDYLDHPDIGFAFLPEYFGKGYAYEIAGATMNHAKHFWNISKISGITITDNVSSIQLLEKLGLNFARKIYMPDSKEELLLYSN